MRKVESIFIIDDDPITVFGIRKMLSLTVVCENVSSFVNGKLAIDAIKKNIEKNEKVPEVIFLDINMPIMDGWQFLKEFIMLDIKQKVRVNIVTSSIDPHDEENWAKYKKLTDHVITYNNKPIKKAQIADITKRA